MQQKDDLTLILAQWIADESVTLDAALTKAGNPDPVVFVETVAINVFKERYTPEDISIAIEDSRVLTLINFRLGRRSDADKIH